MAATRELLRKNESSRPVAHTWVSETTKYASSESTTVAQTRPTRRAVPASTVLASTVLARVMKGGVDAAQRLFAAEHFERLKERRADTATSGRHTQRCLKLAELHI